MKRRFLGISIPVILLAAVAIAILLRALWVTDEFAVNKVVEKFGGPNVTFHYLTEDLPIIDIPKEDTWLPFGRFVTFPGEAGWYVNLFGMV